MRALASRLALAALAAAAASGASGEQWRQVLPGVGAEFHVPMRTMRDLKYASVIRQRYDFSCGSAALASLLRYHYGLAVDEPGVFQGMWKTGDRAQIQKLGFSLLDMKRFLAAEGLQGNGYKVTLSEIARERVPGIALVNIKGYKHFVVVKGVTANEVLIGDPARGLLVEAASKFQKDWNGIYFVISPDERRGAFNMHSQWASVARAPLYGHFSSPLSNTMLANMAPYLGEF